MSNELETKYTREYCCPKCGLIFFSETTTCNNTTCPECGNYKRDMGVVAVDSLSYAYSYDGIVQDLKEHGKKIHYAKKHPMYKGEVDK